MAKREREISEEKIVIPKSEFNKMSRELDDNILEDFAREFCKENYDIDLDIPVKFNGRLTSSFGHYKYDRRTGEGIEISIAKKYSVGAKLFRNEGDIFDILKHECVHYCLHQLGRKHADGDKDFEGELKKLNIASSGATSDSKALSNKSLIYYRVEPEFECTGCGHKFPANTGMSKKEVGIKCKTCKSGKVDKAVATGSVVAKCITLKPIKEDE